MNYKTLFKTVLQMFFFFLQILSFSKHLSNCNVTLDMSDLSQNLFMLFILWWFHQNSQRRKKYSSHAISLHENHVDFYLRGAMKCSRGFKKKIHKKAKRSLNQWWGTYLMPSVAGENASRKKVWPWIDTFHNHNYIK